MKKTAVELGTHPENEHLYRVAGERKERDRHINNARAREILRLAASPDPVPRLTLEALCGR